MIKWVGYGKLLKQSFFTLLISCFILLGSSFVSAITLSKTYQNGSYVQGIDNIELAVYNRGMLSSSRLGNVKRMLGLGSLENSNYTARKYFWWNNGKAYFYWYYKLSTSSTISKKAGYFTMYYLCNSINNISNSSIELTGCTQDGWGDGSFASDFFNSITASDYWGLRNTSNSNRSFNICFSSSSYGKSICFVSDTDVNNNFTSIEMENDIDYISFSNALLGDPPGWSTGGGGGDNGGGSSVNNGGISLSSDDSALNYYENHYGRDESICYAGVNSLSYLYGQNGVSFQEGQGLSIFDIFYQLYGNTDLDKVYVWLNSRLINYENRFYAGSSGPDYLASYNSGTNQVDLYYDNLTFPFANKPVAYYFLADNITSQSERNTMGSSVVSYCNIKINSGTFDEIIDQSQKNNITIYTEKSNTNIGLNPDGTARQYTGAFLGTGVELAFSGNTSIKNTLKNFFNELNRSINVVGSGSVSSILPNWLVVAFLTVVLFRFLRRKK